MIYDKEYLNKPLPVYQPRSPRHNSIRSSIKARLFPTADENGIIRRDFVENNRPFEAYIAQPMPGSPCEVFKVEKTQSWSKNYDQYIKVCGEYEHGHSTGLNLLSSFDNIRVEWRHGSKTRVAKYFGAFAFVVIILAVIVVVIIVVVRHTQSQG